MLVGLSKIEMADYRHFRRSSSAVFAACLWLLRLSLKRGHVYMTSAIFFGIYDPFFLHLLFTQCLSSGHLSVQTSFVHTRQTNLGVPHERSMMTQSSPCRSSSRLPQCIHLLLCILSDDGATLGRPKVYLIVAPANDATLQPMDSFSFQICHHSRRLAEFFFELKCDAFDVGGRLNDAS